MPFSCDIRDLVTKLFSARTAVTHTTVNRRRASFTAFTASSRYLNMLPSAPADRRPIRSGDGLAENLECLP